MNNNKDTSHTSFLSNLKVSLEFVDTFFKYLPYKKTGEQKYSISYYYEEEIPFTNVIDIISEIERCIQYLINEKSDVDIIANIVLEQKVSINGKEIELFYHGQLFVYNTLAFIQWNWYQSTPIIEIRLNDTISPSILLSLFENFQTAMKDILMKYE